MTNNEAKGQALWGGVAGTCGKPFRRRPAKWRRSANLRPWIESLESRALLSTITWNTTAFPNGGNWDYPGSWNGNVVP
jgi:hypothetical protein